MMIRYTNVNNLLFQHVFICLVISERWKVIVIPRLIHQNCLKKREWVEKILNITVIHVILLFGLDSKPFHGIRASLIFNPFKKKKKLNSHPFNDKPNNKLHDNKIQRGTCDSPKNRLHVRGRARWYILHWINMKLVIPYVGSLHLIV